MSAGTYDAKGNLITWQQHIDRSYAKGLLDAQRNTIEAILDDMSRDDRQETLNRFLEMYGYE